MVDRLVYPLVSLYRHGAELALKHLAQVLPRACEETGTFKSSHRITDNWEIVRRCMKKLGAPAAELSQIEDLLKKLVEIDPDSMVFRYPEDKSGSAHLKDTTHINVEVFGSEMAALVPFFESACDWADAIHDMKLDAMEAMGHERPDY